MLAQPETLATAFNIGPEKADILDVETVTQKFIQRFGKGNYVVDSNTNHPHEAHLLMLDNQKIKDTLNWSPKYNATEAIGITAEWYANHEQSAAEKCLLQIEAYLQSSFV